MKVQLLPISSDDSASSTVSGTGSERTGTSEVFATDVVSLRGFPDLAVLADLTPHMVLLVAENKKEKRTWRDEPYDAQLGQTLFLSRCSPDQRTND